MIYGYIITNKKKKQAKKKKDDDTDEKRRAVAPGSRTLDAGRWRRRHMRT